MPQIDDDDRFTNHISRDGERQKTLSDKSRKRRKMLAKLGLGMFVFVLATGFACGLLVHQTYRVSHQLETTMEMVPQLLAQLEDKDSQAAHQTLELIERQTSSARSITAGPLWRIASSVPVVGPNFRAIREVTVSADDISMRAMAPVINMVDSLSWQILSPTDGRIDTTAMEDAAPDISAAAKTVQLSYERISSIDLSPLVPQVADPIGSATDRLRIASEALGTASAAAQLLPDMLGTDSSRNYLVLIQNNAEARASGGIPGALAVLGAEEGRLTLKEQSSASSLGAFSPPVDVDTEQVSLYTARLGTQMQNVNLTPHFPTAAETAKIMWEERHKGQIIDGVIALDPIVLGHLLAATGPVNLIEPGVLELIQDTSLPTTLTTNNVVSTLLSDVYQEINDPKAQDIYFSAVAAEIFASFTTGHGDGGLIAKAITTSVQENRLHLWSSHKSEQALVATTALHGAVTGADSGGTTFGVYFNDGTGAKMDYYAKRTVQLLQGCRSGEYKNYTVRLTVNNGAPKDAASALPAYVTGGGVFGVEPGRIRTNYVVYGPAQSFVEGAKVDGQAVAVGSGKHEQRPVATVTVELAPQESKVIDIDFSRVVQDSEPRLQITPSVQNVQDVILTDIPNKCS